jgi:hypothetical protein
MAYIVVGHADILSLWEPTPWAIASTPPKQAIAHRGGLLQKNHLLKVDQNYAGPYQ